MKQEIANLLETTGATAAEMTHELSVLGYGDMKSGMQLLWLDGHGHGFVEGIVISTVALAGSYAIARIATRKKRQKKQIETIGEAFSAGVASGKRQMEYLRCPFVTEENGAVYPPHDEGHTYGKK